MALSRMKKTDFSIQTAERKRSLCASERKRKRDFSHPQADGFAGANAEEKVGLLRSK